MPISFTCPHCGQRMNVADDFAGQTGPCTKCGGSITIPSAAGPASAPAARAAAPLALILVLGVVCLVVCAGVGVALLLPALNATREAARRAQCMGNLRKITLALQQYEATYGTLPPAYVAGPDGKPWHSWRVLILPYLEQQSLYAQYNFEEPWDGPSNSRLANRIPTVYRCPSSDSKQGLTPYAVIVGAETVFDGSKPMATSGIKDGSPNTILVVEAEGANINWLEPRDLQFDKMTFVINAPGGNDISSDHPGVAVVTYGDGSVSAIRPQDIAPQQLKALITANGNEPVFPP